jgi:uncharacterized protein YbbK (DUF523 family)
MSSTHKPKIAISACLLGENVRFNGGHKQSPGRLGWRVQKAWA